MNDKLTEAQVKRIPKGAIEVFAKFIKAGHEINLVGGAVRDILMRKKPTDIDFTTDATPERIQTFFKDSFYDNKFGTVGIPIKSKDKKAKSKDDIYEITTFRSEVGYTDRRHPDKVTWGKTLKEDLERRDFTINALALGIKEDTKIPGYQDTKILGYRDIRKNLILIDKFAGREDIKSKLIRTVGDPDKRFSEDALRLMRAVRIATQLRFQIEQKTFAAILKNASLLKHISAERIRDEILKIFASDYPADGVRLLLSSGLLAEIIPEITKARGVTQAKHHVYDVWTHSLLSLEKCPSKDPIVRLATFLHDVGKPVVRAYQCQKCRKIFRYKQSPSLICPYCQYKNVSEKATIFYNHEVLSASIVRHLADRLRFSNKQKDKLVTLVRWHQFTNDEFLTDKAIRRFIKRVGKEYIKDMFDLRIGDRLGGGCIRAASWRLKKFMQRVEDVQKHTPSVSDLRVSGHDVMNILGIPPGPKIGKILNALFEEILDEPRRNTKRYLEKRIRELT